MRDPDDRKKKWNQTADHFGIIRHTPTFRLMTNNAEEIEILIQCLGKEQAEKDFSDTSDLIKNKWKSVFDTVSKASPDPAGLNNVLESLQNSISKGFDVPGIDWNKMFAGMEKSLPENTSLVTWWDKILDTMFSSGVPTETIDKFISGIQKRFDEVKIKIPALEPPDIQPSSVNTHRGNTAGIGAEIDVRSLFAANQALSTLRESLKSVEYVARTGISGIILMGPLPDWNTLTRL